MSQTQLRGLRLLDQVVQDRDSLTVLKDLADKAEKCCTAVENKMNLADILQDQGNHQSLLRIVGTEGIDLSLQIILKLALEDFTKSSLTLKKAIDTERKLSFLHTSLGGWKQFNSVFSFLVPVFQNEEIVGQKLVLVNPQNKNHWSRLAKILEGSLVTLWIKSMSEIRSLSQESLAVDRIKAIFEVAQFRDSFREEKPAAVAGVENIRISREARSGKTLPKQGPSIHGVRASETAAALALSFQVVINKMDTFVHAGNAQLILSHLSDYSGRVELRVQRAEKKKIQLDADSIWSAEIRNGEVVVFDFFGPQPSQSFLKELAGKVNKYTQMDKIAN